MKPTEPGYKIPKTIKNELKDLNKTNGGKFYLYILLDYSMIFVPIWFLISIEQLTNLTFWLLYLVCILLSSRSLRGLECIVHDGSHFNWWRRHKLWNDKLTNIFAAYPTFSTVENYRASHLLHHRYLGTELDPDYVRHNELELFKLNRKNKTEFIIHIILRLHIYIPSWWKAIGTNKVTGIKGFIWNIAIILVLSLFTNSITTSLKIWVLGYLIPFIFFLPVLRFIGEAAEHDYEDHTEVATKTFSNIGFFHNLLFHPHNDGYHTIHHLLPSIPHYKLKRLNSKLIEVDNSNYSKILRTRKNIFQ